MLPPTMLTAELAFSFKFEWDQDGDPVVSYIPDINEQKPNSHEERIEWVRQSYERFIEIVREKDNLTRTPALG